MTFEAQYGGRCGVCDERITPGEMCAYSENAVVHADCPPITFARAPRPICDRCFMERPVNGECGCDL